MRWEALFATRNSIAVLVAIAVLAAVTAVRAADPAIITALRELTFDSYQRLRPRESADLPVRVVDIDEASLVALGQWPWPRTRVAALVDRLAELGAAVIALDVIFSEPDRTSPSRLAEAVALGDDAAARGLAEIVSRLPDNDALLAEALARAPVVVGFAVTAEPNAARPPVKAGLAYAGVDPKRALPVFRGSAQPLAAFSEAARGVGSLSLGERDSSGVVRRIPTLVNDGVHVYPSLSVEALRVAQGESTIRLRGTGASGEADTGRPALTGLRVGEIEVPLGADGEIWVRYAPNRADLYVSARDVLDPAKAAEIRPRLEGQIVLVGTSAAGLLDIRATALGELVPGVSIHAQALEQMLSGTFLTRPDWGAGLEILATIVLGVAETLFLLWLGARYSFLIGSVAAALVFAGSWGAYAQYGLLVDPVFPTLSGLAVYMAVTATLYVSTDRERRFVRQAFGQYLAPALLAKLERSPGSLQLGGEMRPMSIMFMDVRDFTPISEALPAVDLVNFLNALMSPLSDAIQDEEGTIDKYIGDSIMAFWNAPVDVSDHPARACRAALRMRAVVDQLNAEDAFGFRAGGRRDLVVKIGIGINSGEACVGNMGSERRFNYSVIGDVVNVAARIESSCKAVGVDLLVSEETARGAPGFALLEAGEIALKGKSRPAKLFALVGDEALARTPDFEELSRAHARLIAAVDREDADAAEAALGACRALGGERLARFYDVFERRLPARLPALAQAELA